MKAPTPFWESVRLLLLALLDRVGMTNLCLGDIAKSRDCHLRSLGAFKWVVLVMLSFHHSHAKE
jgi:hypothetical protein